MTNTTGSFINFIVSSEHHVYFMHLLHLVKGGGNFIHKNTRVNEQLFRGHKKTAYIYKNSNISRTQNYYII